MYTMLRPVGAASCPRGPITRAVYHDGDTEAEFVDLCTVPKSGLADKRVHPNEPEMAHTYSEFFEFRPFHLPDRR